METQRTYTQAELSALIAAAVAKAGDVTKEAIEAKKAENKRISYEAQRVFENAFKNHYQDIVLKFSVHKNYYLAGGAPITDNYSVTIFRMITNLALNLAGADSPREAVAFGVTQEANYYAEIICEAILKGV